MRNTVQTARKPEAGKEPTEARTEGREQNEPEPQTHAVVSDVNALCQPKTVKRVQNQDPHHGHKKSAPGRGRKPDVGRRTRDAVHTRRVTESHDLTPASPDQPTSPRKFNLEMPL